ncbi:MAG: hypothetical protein O3C58_13100 [Nitrospinae bacterium]|nr:hypothetical protein [Nitrospinota bacterium]
MKNQWGSNGRNVPVDSSKVSKSRGSFPNDEAFVFSVEEYLEEVDDADPTMMEAGFESVCDSISWKDDRKLAYGLVKNKKPFFTGPTGSATRLFFSFL